MSETPDKSDACFGKDEDSDSRFELEGCFDDERRRGLGLQRLLDRNCPLCAALGARGGGSGSGGGSGGGGGD